MKTSGIIISGKICSGKGIFLDVFNKLTNNKVVQLAFADILKVLAKYLLVSLSQKNEQEAVEVVSRHIVEKILGNDQSFYPKTVEKIGWLASQPHTKEFCSSELRMPIFDAEDNGFNLTKKNFGFGDIDKLLWTDCKKPRKMLQELGTECMRSVKDSVWVDFVFSVVAANPECFFCITDGRFPNEIDRAKKEKFLDIRVEADKETRIKRGLGRDGQDYSNMLLHASEVSLDDYTFSVVLDNNGTEDDLKNQILENDRLKDLACRLR